MKSINRHIKNIINANNNNRLAIFIGAGISKSSENKSLTLPTWNDIITDFKKDLNLRTENDFLKIAQLYYLEFKEYSYYEKLKKYFPENIKPSSIHKQIFELNPQVLITTNWDNILEKAIEENAYIYDTIRSDEDLVKSTIQKKLIKMHGDFKSHNIVFKEDDYLNYHYNFPLIENYIKSILSTHTIVFLGYSYNDINLKHIMKWLQNHSKVQPPIYLITSNENITQSKYLENHGITVIALDNPHANPDETVEYSENIKQFLTLLKNYDSTVSIESDDDVINFVYSKLEPLKDLNGILLEQIQAALTNCGFVYEDNKTILEFYNNTATYDFNKEKRIIYNRFIKIFKKIESEDLKNYEIVKILEILDKANIDGISISEDDAPGLPKEYIEIQNYLVGIFNNSESAYINFDFKDLTETTNNNVYDLQELAFKFYQLGDREKAYYLLEKIIPLCLEQRAYALLFIAMFNRNAILSHLKIYHVNHEKYSSIQEYNLKEKFNSLPKDFQIIIDPIYSFLNFNYLYRYVFDISQELKKKEESKQTIASGGFVFSRNITKSSSEHRNLVLFVIRNNIMIENFIEYKTINKYFIEISLIRQIQAENTTLNKIELYSAIKYIRNKDLKIILEQFYASDSGNKGKFTLANEERLWLIDIVFSNIIDIYIETKDVFNNFGNYLENIIFLLSLTKLSEGETKKVLNHFFKIINESKNTIGSYQSINLFLDIQYDLYKAEIDEDSLLKIIEIIIYKFAYKKYNGFDYSAIALNQIPSLYGYAKIRKAIFNNNQLLDKLLSELKDASIPEQINISQSLLLNIYDISNIEIKDKIKNFILVIDSKGQELETILRFELHLIILEFKNINDDLIEKFNIYLEKFAGGKSFSSVLYTLKSQVDYLLKEKKFTMLESISTKIVKAIENYENRKFPSIF